MNDWMYRDWSQAKLGYGDLILDGSGDPWRIKDFDYGRENVAICTGQAYNHRSARAVLLGSCFKIKDIPMSRKAGVAVYEQLFAVLVASSEQEKLRRRKQDFQRLRKV